MTLVHAPPRSSRSVGAGVAIQHRPTVAVVGAGFSGLLTTLRLLDDPHGPRVRLIERRAPFARGAAYATPDAEALLNVRAANMSAYPQDPGHFTGWLAQKGTGDAPATFVSRRRFGDYLQALLRQAADRAEAGRLILEADAAVAATPDGGGWRVGMAMGRSFDADAVVLAIGNLPPHTPPGFDEDAAASPAYVGDPWGSADRERGREGTALLLGTGLTMVDVALRLADRAPGLRMLALSRRGLLPRRHLAQGPAPAPWTPGESASVRAVLRDLRRRAADEGEWRATLDGLRPQIQALWSGWPLEQRRRFLRHARPWWDVHRHRLAPAVASKLDHLMASGVLTVAAGRVARVRAAGDGLTIAWTPRGDPQARNTSAILAVNCTGPQGDLARSSDPLLSDLAQAGRIRADDCRLGLDVDAQSRLIDADGKPCPTLFAVGPVTRGAFWETTSVPDIRVQAAQCAERLLHLLAAPSETPGRSSTPPPAIA